MEKRIAAHDAERLKVILSDLDETFEELETTGFPEDFESEIKSLVGEIEQITGSIEGDSSAYIRGRLVNLRLLIGHYFSGGESPIILTKMKSESSNIRNAIDE